MTLIRIHVDDQLAGDAADTFTVWVPGGTIGCAKYSITDYPHDIQVGQRFVVGTRDVLPKTGVRGVMQAEALWPIDDQGYVIARYDGRLTLEEVVARIRAARQEP